MVQSTGVNHGGHKAECRWVKGSSGGTDTDHPVCQEGRFNRMKWSVETDETEKSPEGNIEEFPLHLAIRQPLATRALVAKI